MSRSVFLVIDVLNDFFRNQPLSGRRMELASAINQLVRSFRAGRQPIIWVRQEFEPDLSGGLKQVKR